MPILLSFQGSNPILAMGSFSYLLYQKTKTGMLKNGKKLKKC